MSENALVREALESTGPAEIVTLYGKHRIDPNEVGPGKNNLWYPEVIDRVCANDPDFLVLDSVDSGFVPDRSLVPLTEQYIRQRKALGKLPVRVISADSTHLANAIYQNQYSAMISDGYEIGPDSDYSQHVGSKLTQGNLIEADAVLIAFLGLSLIGNKLSKSLTVRSFLKLSTVSVGLGVLDFATKQFLTSALVGLLNSTNNLDRGKALQDFLSNIAPEWMHDSLLELRNLKLGLTAIACAQDKTLFPGVKRVKGNIVFGGYHSMGTDPASAQEVLLRKMKVFLDRADSALTFADAFGKTDVLFNTLVDYLARYDVNEIDDTLAVRVIPFRQKMLIPEVKEMLDEMFHRSTN